MIEGVSYVRAFYTGMSIVSSNSLLRYEVRDITTSGEQGALILTPNDQGKRRKTELLTLFCPFTLQAHQITPLAGEISQVVDVMKETRIEGMKEPKRELIPTVVRKEEQALDDDRIDRLSGIICSNWKMRCRLGLPFDLDIAALVLSRLNRPIPEERPAVRVDEKGEVKKSGKDANAELIKSVNPESKPAQVLRYFMEERKSLTEAMANFGSTRSSLQSSLYQMWKENGIGYSIAADIVTILLPPDCEDPFSPPAKKGSAEKTAHAAEKKPRGKPLIADVKPLPDKGKRRETALATYKDWAKIEDVAKTLECSVNSIKSHLNDLHTKHGFGYEIDSDRCRLLVPEGFRP